MSGKVRVFGPRDKQIPQGDVNINVTSQSKSDRGKTLSPFLLGPVPLYWGLTAKRVENAWQFSKVYKEYATSTRTPKGTYSTDLWPSHKWFKWALKGFNDTYAHRHPMGKGAKPLFSYWRGEKLDYIQARKRIYSPLY